MSPLLSFLVVEDSKMVRDMLQNLLVEEGHFDVSVAEDGEIALQRVRSQALLEKPFNVLICDWEMPGRSGLDFLRQASLIMNLRRTAVLMVTSIADEARVKEAIKFGVDDYLIKPFPPALFREKLQRLLVKKSLLS